MISYKIKKMEKITLGSLNDRQTVRDETGASFLHLSVKDAVHYNLAPRTYPAANDLVKITSYLIFCGYEIDAKDNEGRTPLMFAANADRPHISTMKVLLDANASIYITDNKGQSVLKIIIQKCRKWLKNLKPGIEQLQVLELIFNQVKKDYFNDKLATLAKLREVDCSIALMAFMNGSSEVTKSLLIDNSMKPALYKRTYGLTALHIAVMRQDLEQVKVLIDWGVDINAEDNQGQTALFAHDIKSKETDVKIEILKILLKSGASLITSREHRFQNDGETPMEYFLKHGKKETVFTVLRSNHPDLLKKCGPDGTALHFLVQNRNFLFDTAAEAIMLLLNKGFDINACNCRGLNALTVAVIREDRTKFEDMIMFLIQNGAKANFLKILKKTSELDYFEAAYALEFYQKIIELIFKQQNIDICRATKQMNRRYPKENDSAVVMHIVTAYLVIAEAKGEISYFLNQRNIAANDTLQDCYDQCSIEVEEMRSEVVKDSVTLYSFLTESDDKIISYVQKEDLILHLKKLIKKKIYQDSYYSVIIHSRVKTAKKIIKQRQDGARVFCKLMGLEKYGMTEDHHILENIFCHFTDKDFENLVNVQPVRSTAPKTLADALQFVVNFLSEKIKKNSR